MEMPSWARSDETKPAPMPLLRVQSFVNTWESDSGVDLLADPSSARPWLTDVGLLESGQAITADDLAHARAVREGMRALLVENSGGPAPRAEELGAMRALGRSARLQILVSKEGHIELGTEEPAAQLQLGQLLVIIRDSQHEGTWRRLKACQNVDCTWAFYDRSHAGRGAWCDMAVCGNRIKNRNLRARKSNLSTDLR